MSENKDTPAKDGAGKSGDDKRRRRRRRRPGGPNSSENPAVDRKDGGEGKRERGDAKSRDARPGGQKPDGQKRRRSGRSGGKGPNRERGGGERRDKRDGDRQKGDPSRKRQEGDSRRRDRDSIPDPSQTAHTAFDAPSSLDLTPPPPLEAADEDIDTLTTDADASGPWGDDRDAPEPTEPPPAKLPPGPPADDFDPASYELLSEAPMPQLGSRVVELVGVRFAVAGRIYHFDAGDAYYQVGDEVWVEAERGERRGTIAVLGGRQIPERSLRRVLRKLDARDTAPSERQDEFAKYLQIAKDEAKALRLPVKVFRIGAESDDKIAVYYSCDDKTDVRRLARALSDALPLRVELKHVGARDEAKMVGGIGSCGMELCCSTWLPAFVPVSIKNAKDQGLVLNPTKVSGQCGRLKCCLVYEQAQYAELRKGLPKLGKRVITNDGHEGRVIEVDVLHERFRVSIGRGESKIYYRGEVEPMFASQQQGSGSPGKAKKKKKGRGSDDDADASTSESSAGSADSPSKETSDVES